MKNLYLTAEEGDRHECDWSFGYEIDEKVVEVVKAQHKKALDILNENKDKLHELANFLYEKETITGEEFMRILES